MTTAAATEPGVRPFEMTSDLDRAVLVASVHRPGAALLEGWSDTEPWKILLPWPEEVRKLSWKEISDWRSAIDGLEIPPLDNDPFPEAPFLGGWIGHLGYELGAVEEGAQLPDSLPPEPPLYFARHECGLLASGKRKWIFGPANSMDAIERNMRELLERATKATTSNRFSLSEHEGRLSLEDSLAGGAYQRRVGQIREAIAAGEVYQINLTRRFETETIDPVNLYLALTGAMPPRCSALLRGENWTIASASPEVFLRFDRNSGIAESRPIKGTVRRRGDDRNEIHALLASEKDAAEHLMIVDLVRNDLGKIAPGGRVSVPQYRTVRTLEHVHHLESTVRAEQTGERSISEVVAALFPAGSITGAPKRAAVGMIRELEPVARGVYTGAIGFFDVRGRTEMSVAIRTAVVTATSARYHAGGGIVWESDPAAEDDESLAKSLAFLRYVEGSER